MAQDQAPSVSSLARTAARACRNLAGFDATQTVEAGPVRAVARVRFHRPDQLTVEYQAYASPLLELEERLTGDAEYTSEELVGLSAHFDGQHTWLYDAAARVCVVKASRSVFEPIPEMALLGDIEYLRDLPHDYLLRDLGMETVDGRSTRVLSLKPKHRQRTHSFKVLAFLAERASVALDEETLFPVRLTFVPSSATQVSRLLGPDSRVVVRYASVRLASDPSIPFAPPEGTRVFREELVGLEQLSERLPFSFPTEPFRRAQLEPIENRALLVEDIEHRRAYCGTTFLRRETSEDALPQYVTLRVGNYLSRNMARRRTTLAEEGNELSVAGRTARFLDRRPLWETQATGLDPSQAPCELYWEQDGVFWFLTAVRTEQATLTGLASDLIAAAASE